MWSCSQVPVVDDINTETGGFPCGSGSKECAMWVTPVRSLGSEDPLEKGIGFPVQYPFSCLENFMDRGA